MTAPTASISPLPVERQAAQRPSPQQRRARCSLLLSSRARPVRFVAVGGLCGLLQLTLLIVLTRCGLDAVPANVAAYLASAQVNFYLSDRFIWHDCRQAKIARRKLLQRWVSFHVSIVGSFLLTQAVFIFARAVAPDVLASALGIGVAAIVNFLVQDRLVFRRR